MSSDGLNVFGVIQAPAGLVPLWQTLRDAFGRHAASWRMSGFDGHEIVRLELESANFDTEPLGNGEYLFNGDVGGCGADAEKFVLRLSGVLGAASIKHVLELYDDDGGLIREFKTD